MPIEIPESHRDLLDAQVGELATVGASGYPQVSVVWFLWEDGKVKTSIHTSRQKFKNAVRTGKATFVVVDPANPYRYLEIRGDVSVEPDGSETAGFDQALAALVDDSFGRWTVAAIAAGLACYAVWSWIEAARRRT